MASAVHKVGVEVRSSRSLSQTNFRSENDRALPMRIPRRRDRTAQAKAVNH